MISSERTDEIVVLSPTSPTIARRRRAARARARSSARHCDPRAPAPSCTRPPRPSRRRPRRTRRRRRRRRTRARSRRRAWSRDDARLSSGRRRLETTTRNRHVCARAIQATRRSAVTPWYSAAHAAASSRVARRTVTPASACSSSSSSSGGGSSGGGASAASKEKRPSSSHRHGVICWRHFGIIWTGVSKRPTPPKRRATRRRDAT